MTMYQLGQSSVAKARRCAYGVSRLSQNSTNLLLSSDLLQGGKSSHSHHYEKQAQPEINTTRSPHLVSILSQVPPD